MIIAIFSYTFQTSSSMKNFLFLSIPMIVLPIILSISSCSKDDETPKQPKPIVLPEKSAKVISCTNDFGIELFSLVAQGNDDNLMLSPLSASIALTMALNGSKGNTWQQISDLLGFHDLTQEEVNQIYHQLNTQLLTIDPEVELSLANAVWYRNSFTVKQEFIRTMQEVFDAQTQSLDFNNPEALKTINQWASDCTKGKITKVLTEINPYEVMFLMNALYFKGTWTYSFDKKLTTDAFFYPEGQVPLKVSMMNGEIPLKIYGTNDFTAVEMPYNQQNFVMDILLPTGKLSEFLSNFTSDTYNSLMTSFESIEPSKIHLSMPKFDFSYEKKLNEQLKTMGMTDAFDPDMADFSGISDENIYISFVKQNTFIELDEEGTEAAAVTTIGMAYTSANLNQLIINKPFIFSIRERTTNTLLFIGKVEMP